MTLHSNLSCTHAASHLLYRVPAHTEEHNARCLPNARTALLHTNLDPHTLNTPVSLGTWNLVGNDSEDKRHNVITEKEWYETLPQGLGLSRPMACDRNSLSEEDTEGTVERYREVGRTELEYGSSDGHGNDVFTL